MSALALAFASASEEEQKVKLRENMIRMVNELRECQERTFVWNEELGRYWEARDFAPEDELREMKGTWKDFDKHKTEWEKYGYGYLNAIPAHHAALIEMYRAYNNESWVWAPYYSIHKQLAGLIDIATYIDVPEVAGKALLIAKDMGLWVWNRLYYRTFIEMEGTQEERRAKPGNRYEMWNMYIAGEDGGTGESLARLSEMVSDPTEKARLLEASNFFDSPAFYDPLSKNIDDIRTRHANQHIPKIISAVAICFLSIFAQLNIFVVAFLEVISLEPADCLVLEMRIMGCLGDNFLGFQYPFLLNQVVIISNLGKCRTASYCLKGLVILRMRGALP